MGTYTTIQGDTWDLIAKKIYGSEVYADFLMQKNYPHLDILIFPAGTVLTAPALPDSAVNAAQLPAWRRQ